MTIRNFSSKVFTCVLAFGLLCACNNDDVFEQNIENLEQEAHSHTDPFGRKVENVSPKQIPFIVEYIGNQRAGYLNSGNTNRSQNEQSNPFGTVNLDYIQALINDEAADDKTYTFAMTVPSDISDEFANLVVRVIGGEIIRAYINVYCLFPHS